MQHTKLIGRIALALSLESFIGANFAASVAQDAANQPLIKSPDT